MFEITADHAGQAHVASRVSQNSAMALADRWAEKGFANIRILDADGLLRDRPQFRNLLWAKYRTKTA